jgi:hypothetical protein
VSYCFYTQAQELWKGTALARETITKLIDDMDGTVATETVTFGLDGYQYQIDLSAKNAKKLRTELAPYLERGHRVTGRATAAVRGGRRGRATAGDKDQNKAIREWAARKGMDVALRGRIRQDIIDEYHKSAGR